METLDLSQESSQIKEVAYDNDTQLLRITFHRGDVYEYEGVPINIVQTLVHAPSIGRYFNINIKNKFKTFRISAAAGSIFNRTEVIF